MRLKFGLAFVLQSVRSGSADIGLTLNFTTLTTERLTNCISCCQTTKFLCCATQQQWGGYNIYNESECKFDHPTYLTIGRPEAEIESIQISMIPMGFTAGKWKTRIRPFTGLGAFGLGLGG